MGYSKEQLDKYMAYVKSSAGDKYSPEQLAQYEEYVRKAHAEAEPGLVSQVLDGAGRVLYYAGGLGRTGAAALAEPFTGKDLVTKDDFTEALKGNAPGTEEFLKRSGISDQKKISDFLPHLYSETGDGLALKKGGTFDPSARATAGFVGDIALDPMTYFSGGISAAAKAKNAGKLIKALNVAVNPLEVGLATGGKKLYKSGLKEADRVAANFGKRPLSELLWEKGVWGTDNQIVKKTADMANKLDDQRKSILQYATDKGAKVNMDEAMEMAQKRIDAMRASKDPNLQTLADTMQDDLNSYRGLGDKDLWTGKVSYDVSPNQASGFKTTTYEKIGDSAFDQSRKTKSGKRILKAKAHGLDKATDAAVNSVDPGLGKKLSDVNDDLGLLLTTQKSLRNKAAVTLRKNLVTQIDAMAALYPKLLAAKQGGKILGSTWARTGGGLLMDKASRTPLLDTAVRRFMLRDEVEPDEAPRSQQQSIYTKMAGKK